MNFSYPVGDMMNPDSSYNARSGQRPVSPNYQAPWQAVTPLVLALLLLAWTPQPAEAQLQKEDFTLRAGGILTFPSAPDELADNYNSGRGAAVGLKVFMTNSFKFTTDLSLVKYNSQLGPNFVSGPLRPDRQFDPVSLDGRVRSGDLTELRVSAGLEYQFFTLSELTTPYLLASAHMSRLARDAYDVEGAVVTDPEISEILSSQSELATGVEFGLGLQIGLSYTTALYIEPTYSITYAEYEQFHAIGIGVGFNFGEF